MKRLVLALLIGFVPLSLVLAQDEQEKPSLAGGQAAPGIDWQPFEAAVAKAKGSGNKVLVDIYAPWCGWCTKLQNEVYSDEAIQAYVNEHFEIARLDIDNSEDTYTFKEYTLTPAELASGLGAQGTPTTVFLASNSDYITRLPGFVDAEQFLNILRYIGTDAFKDQTFEEYMQATGTLPNADGK